MEASTSQNSSSSNVGCLIVVKSADEVNDNDAAEEDPPSIEEITLNHPLEIFQSDAGSEEEDEDDDDDNEAPNFMSAFVDNINTCRRESQFQRSTANNSNTLREKGMLRPANVARRNSFRATICDVISAARFVDRKGPDVKDEDGGPDVEVSQEGGDGGDQDEDGDEDDDEEEEEDEEDEEDQTKQALHLKNVANYVESFICNITGDVEMSHEYLNKVAIPPKTLPNASSKTNTSVSIGNANIGSVTNNMNNNIIIVKQAPNDDDDPCSSKTLESSPPSSGDKAAANLANATTINYVFNFFKRKKNKTSKKVAEESQVEGPSLLDPKTAEIPGQNPRRKSGWTTVKVGRAFNFWGRRKTPKGVTFGGSDDEDDAEPGSSEENKGTGKRWSGAVTRLTDTIFLLRSKNARQEARKARRRSLKKVTQGVIKSNAVDKAKDRLEKQKETPKVVQRTRSVDDDDDEDRGCCNDEECLCRIS